jgi:pimeloyl-ACP methyl ester carboxylesterase
MFRRALGEDRLSFGMISNSGPVAAVYAALFPKQVRAMLIDSTVAPKFRDYAIERWSEESASYDLALQRVDQLCRRDVMCPLRDMGVVAAFDTVYAGLLSEPVTAPNGKRFTARDLSDAFFSSAAGRTVLAAHRGCLVSGTRWRLHVLLAASIASEPGERRHYRPILQ